MVDYQWKNSAIVFQTSRGNTRVWWEWRNLPTKRKIKGIKGENNRIQEERMNKHKITPNIPHRYKDKIINKTKVIILEFILSTTIVA